MLDFSPLVTRWQFLLNAFWVTVYISLLSMAFGFVIGVIVGALRTYGGRGIDRVLGFYVDSMRSLPQLVVLVWTFFAFPLIAGRRFVASS